MRPRNFVPIVIIGLVVAVLLISCVYRFVLPAKVQSAQVLAAHKAEYDGKLVTVTADVFILPGLTYVPGSSGSPAVLEIQPQLPSPGRYRITGRYDAERNVLMSVSAKFLGYPNASGSDILR